MGELILCRQPIAANPYYIESLSLNIYSLEELSRYIYQNTDLIDRDFFSSDLTDWIYNDINEHELAKKLNTMIGENSALHEMTELLLDSNGYLTMTEIREAVANVTAIENKTPFERNKLRADRLMEKERFADAIYAYEDLLHEDNLPVALSGRICHNVGCAYARLFFFEEAAQYFEKSYNKTHSTASLNALLYALRLNGDGDRYNETVRKYHFLKSQTDDAAAAFDEALGSKEIMDFDQKIDMISRRDQEGAAGNEELSAIVNGWKADYNRYCRI